MVHKISSAWVVLIVTALFIGSSFVTPFAGFEPDAFPVPQENPPAQPAGYAFAIWGIIYLWLFASALFGVMKRSEDSGWATVRGPLTVSLGIGIFWLSIATRSPIGATVVIWAMFGFALWALMKTPAQDRLWLRTPVALYAGWLAAASCVSIALIGAGYGIAFDATVWAFITTIAATALAGAILRAKADIPEFGVAVVWALIAIAAKAANDLTVLAVVAGLCSMFIATLSVIAATSANATHS